MTLICCEGLGSLHCCGVGRDFKERQGEGRSLIPQLLNVEDVQTFCVHSISEGLKVNFCPRVATNLSE